MKNLPWATALLLTLYAGTATGQVSTIRVVNAGSLLADDLSPGSMIFIQGTNLADVTAATPDQQTPFSVLMGVSIKIGDVPAGLLSISPTQVTAVVDPSTPIGAATLTLTTPTSAMSAAVNIQRTAAPALFAASQSGGREGILLNTATFSHGPFSVTTNGAPTTLALYLTSLDLNTPPAVTIGGLPATVVSYGSASCCAGMEEVDVQAPAELAGAGRVNVIVTSGGRASNAVETVLLPNRGQGPFAPAAENAPRNREIGAIAYVQPVGITMVLDEQDDVIRVVDMKQRTVTRTIALASGSQPFAIAANSAGTQAVVAERGRAKVAFIDINRGYVVTEIPVGSGPSAVAVNGDIVVVANEDSDTVSILSLTLKQVLDTVAVGRSPRAVVIDDNTSLAYVANQNGGTISVIDLGRRSVAGTLMPGANSRPQVLRLLPSGGLLAATDPDAGVVTFFDLAANTRFTARAAAADLQFLRNTVYLGNQTGASASFASLSTTPPGINMDAANAIAVDPGVRSLAIDPLDNLLLVSSQSSGTLSLIDLTSNRLTGTISAVRSANEAAARDDRSDREHANNTPVISSITPSQAAAGSTVQLTVNSSYFNGAFDLYFVDENGNRDPAMAVTAMDVDPTGGQVRITVQIAPGAAKGGHLLRAFTPNGESSSTPLGGNQLMIL